MFDGKRLSPVFAPASAAIIGASERSHYASSLQQNLVQAGFPLEFLYPVNPRQKQIFGLPCYPSVKEVPHPVDLAVMAVPQSLVVPLAGECGGKGVKALLVLSTGFAETGEEGKKRQEELSAVARQYEMLLLGPNTLGYAVPRSKAWFWSTALPQGLSHGKVGALFHSSGMLNLFFNMASQRGIGFSVGLAPGNEAGLNLSDYLSWVVEDEETKIIVLVIESIREPSQFRVALERARELKKPVVALRLGQSARAQRSILSHTGSLATGVEAWNALFDQTGVVRVENLDEILEAAVFFNSWGASSIKASTIGLMTISGGDCSLLSDICDRVRLPLPDLGGESRKVIAAELKKDSFLGNPLDIEDLLASNTEGFYRSLESFASDPAFGVIGCRLNISERPSERMRAAYVRVSEIVKRAGKQLVFFSRASEQIHREWFELFSSLGVPFLLEYEKGLRTVRRAMGLTEKWKDAEKDVEGRKAGKSPPPMEWKDRLAALSAGPLTLRDTLALLQQYGIPFAPTEIAVSAEEAGAVAKAMGFPVVLKVASVDITHRSEIQAVQAGLKDVAEVETAYREILGRCHESKPGCKIEGVAVQPMVKAVAEVILGVSRDPQLGPVILLGMGGIFVEILKDVILRIPPLGIRECREMIRSLRGRAIMEGARGRQAGDLDALARAIHSLSRLAVDLQDEIEEIDLNPVMVCPRGQGVLAVDGLVVTRRRQK